MTSVGNVVVIDVATVVIVDVVVGVVGRRVSVVDVANSLEKMARRKRESNLGSLHDMAARFILMAFVVADGHCPRSLKKYEELAANQMPS